MTASEWAHLPNARHIDAVLADVQARPEAWKAEGAATWEAIGGKAWERAWDAARDAVWAAVGDAVWAAAQGAVWDAARDTVWAAAWSTVLDAVFALITWDSSADLLDLPPDVLRTMADLAPEPVCHQAVLLLPYAIVRATD